MELTKNKTEESRGISFKRFMDLIGKALVTPYNWSLLVITILWNRVGGLSYWNKNFDLLSSIENQILYVSLVAIILGVTTIKEHSRELGQMGVISTILAVLSLTFGKVIATIWIGSWMVLLSQFCFFVMLKYIWLIVMQKECK